VALAKTAFHVGSRAAERVLPPIFMWFLLVPLTELLAARNARRFHQVRVPAPSLPVPDDAQRPGPFQRWRYFSREARHWWLLGWMDRLSAPKWQKRVEVAGLDKLQGRLAVKPVIVCSVHTSSLMTMAAWLRSMDIPTAHLPLHPDWFNNPAQLRKAALTEKMGPFNIRPDQPRAIVKYLTPGHVLVLAADYTDGRVTHVPWGNATVTVATGPFRLARATGAAVVPVLILDTGRWKYEITVFDAVPDATIEGGDTDAAARYVVNCLYPRAVTRPEQAMPVLISAIS
jgi:lauroyl/myristoyl acyltransferase